MNEPVQSDRVDKSFHWLNATQFLGALNDNIFKLLVTFFLIRSIGPEHASTLSGLGGIIFALPFILFVPAAGVLADRFSKSRLTVWAKGAEVAVMVSGTLAFWLAPPWVGFVILFLMSTQSAFFNPTKYGIIPELVQPHHLSRANGYLVALTYLSIILGTVAAPWITTQVVGAGLEQRDGSRFALAALACVIIALAGISTSLGIRRLPPVGSRRSLGLKFWSDIHTTYKANRHDRFLLLAILASAYFSLLGAFIQMNLIPYAMEHLDLSETEGGLMFLYAAFGIGFGSLMAGRLSGRNIEFGMIPAGALLIAFATLLLYLLPAGVNTTKVLIGAAGLGAGLFIIPVEAFIQYRAPRDQIGSVVAANGFLSWVGVLLAGMLVFGLSFIPWWKPSYTFGLLGVITLVMTGACLLVLPDFFVRFIAMLLVRSVYRIERIGIDNLPREGGGLLVANHVSRSDALIILASQQRRIRFLMERSIYQAHPLRRLFDLMRVIPISTDDGPKALLRSLHDARKAMDDGYLVCIFAEGALTRNGQMQAFQPGFVRMMKGAPYPIIPLHLGGVWGSRFSHFRTIIRGSKPPIRWRYPVTMTVGAALPPDARTWQVYRAIQQLGAQHYDNRLGPGRSVAARFIASARRNRQLPAVADTTGKSLTHGRLLIASLAAARLFGRSLAGQPRVGVILPPSVGGVLVNLSLIMAGKVPVNLNFTASPDALRSAMKQAGIDTVITARKVKDKLSEVPWPSSLLFADELPSMITVKDRLIAVMSAYLAPSTWLAPRLPEGGDDPLTIMFSSGTTGEPKGVVLSHHNILSNIEALTEVFRPDPDLHLCATLPLFHSFGFTAGICFPMLCGLRASYHTSPLDAGQVVDLIHQGQCNVLFSTPSFLGSYMRKADPHHFQSLRFILVGAEKLSRQLSDAFHQKFGIRPLEGYGTTEMAPVVALNLPEIPGTRQLGHKEGSIGRPLPGIAATVVHPESGEELPPEQAGMLLVKGPNRMTGYLNRKDLTEKAFRGDWYITGDIAKIDEDGFIFITDRLFRFSKIGGEMVPHIAIEEVVAEALHLAELAVAVTSVPDERKGERLALLYTPAIPNPAVIKQALDQSNLPNLWKPSESMFLKVDELPLTATGKVDVAKLRQVARSMIGPPT
ncbi:MAG TPA: MFS transporter [Kiritimatiellia bacterium]|nr:MFS transporter [Kiritimatiellia bacterium]